MINSTFLIRRQNSIQMIRSISSNYSSDDFWFSSNNFIAFSNYSLTIRVSIRLIKRVLNSGDIRLSFLILVS